MQDSIFRRLSSVSSMVFYILGVCWIVAYIITAIPPNTANYDTLCVGILFALLAKVNDIHNDIIASLQR